MKQSKIQSVHMYASEKQSSSNIPVQAANLHLRFVRRRLDELNLSRNDKITVINAMLANLKIR